MTTGPDGNGLVTYNTVSQQITLACANADCNSSNSNTIAVAPGGSLMSPSATAVGRDGLGLLVNNEQNLVVRHCVNAYCTATTAPVTIAGADTGPAAVAIGGDGLGVIAYHEITNNDLGVAHCVDVACSSVTTVLVDQFGDVGRNPSIAIGPDGLPLISYYDATNADLKVVHCGDPACQAPIGTVFRTGPSLVNGGFETGSVTGWTESGASIRMTSASHTGSFAALLGASTATNGDSSIAQTFTTDTGNSTLSFWYNVTCSGTVTSDWATATLTDTTAGTTTTPLAKTCVAASGWTKVTVPVIAGHTYTLTLTSHDDNTPGDPTQTAFDDVTVS